MSTATLQRPARAIPVARGARPRSGAAGSSGRSGHRAAPLAVVVAVLAVLAAAAWSFMRAPEVGAPLGPGELAVDAGLARVDSVVSAARPMHAMPGMGTDNDPVAEGERRVSVDITLLATGDEAVDYAVQEFALQVPGGTAEQPHKSVLPGDVLPAGTQLSGTLIFDVPIDATTGTLSYAGQGGLEVTLPPEGAQGGSGSPAPVPGAGHDAGHGTG